MLISFLGNIIMRSFLILVCFLLSLIIFLVATKPNFYENKDGYIQSEKSLPLEESNDQDENLKSLVITKLSDIYKIEDIKLRAFVRKNALFVKDKVLYFEWKGNSTDYFAIEPMIKGEKYKIVLHKSKEDSSKKSIHKKVYVIPKNSDFEIEIK